jgi:hypothetical protein
MSSTPTPNNIGDDDPVEPTSYFELEQRRAAGEVKLGGEKMPVLPASHWSNDPVPAEPTINREDDSDTMGVPIDDLNR